MSEIWTPDEERRTAFSREVVLAVEPHPSRERYTPDGRRIAESTITLTAEAADMMWAGYMCAKCLERFREAYPEKCKVCGFLVKENQRRLLERDFKGVDPTVVGGFPLDRERAYLEETHYKKKGLMTVPKEIKPR